MADRKKVLITGGFGFVGTNFWEYLRQYPELRKGYVFKRFRSKDINLCDESHVAKLWKEQKPNTVIHLAALCGGIGKNMMFPGTFWDRNIIMGANVLASCAQFKTEKLITLGTVCSYGKNATPPFTEDMLYTEWPEPTNRPYGVAKLAIYEGCRAHNIENNLAFSYLIPTNMYGPYDNFDLETSHVIPALIRKMHDAVTKHKYKISLWGDGSPTRDFLYVTDACRAIYNSMEVDTGNYPLNLGTGEEVKMGALAEMIASVVDFSGDIEWDKSKPNGQPRRSVDSTRAKNVLGWNSTTTLIDGLKQTYEWYKQTIKPVKSDEE